MLLNGNDLSLEGEIHLDELLKNVGFELSRVVVMLNNEVVPRAQLALRLVGPGDEVEVLSFVGGG